MNKMVRSFILRCVFSVIFLSKTSAFQFPVVPKPSDATNQNVVNKLDEVEKLCALVEENQITQLKYLEREVKTLSDRVTQLQDLHAKDVHVLTHRINQLEQLRAKDVRNLTHRVTQLENLRAKDVRELAHCLTPLEKLHAKEVQIPTDHVTQLENTQTNDVQISTNRIIQMENNCTKDVDRVSKPVDLSFEVIQGQSDRNTKHKAINSNGKKDFNDKILDPELVTEPSGNKNAATEPQATSLNLKGPGNQHTRRGLFQTKTPSNGLNELQNERYIDDIPDNLGTTITEDDDHLDLSKRYRIGRVGSLDNFVAFSAILHHNDSDVRDKTLAFTDTITKVNAQVSPNTGVFRCTQPGVYFFSWTIAVNNEHSAHSSLIRNGAVIGTALSADLFTASSGSASVVLELDLGDEIWIKVSSPNPGTVVYSGSFTTFTGFRLN